jgi:succinate dehydrogenase flavin-adding protein (antitoxin of CptAB toxin-antitoxin module)
VEVKGHYGLTKRELLDQLAEVDVTLSTLASILDLREHVLWRWFYSNAAIPQKYESKIITLLHYLSLKKS